MSHQKCISRRDGVCWALSVPSVQSSGCAPVPLQPGPASGERGCPATGVWDHSITGMEQPGLEGSLQLLWLPPRAGTRSTTPARSEVPSQASCVCANEAVKGHRATANQQTPQYSLFPCLCVLCHPGNSLPCRAEAEELTAWLFPSSDRVKI